MNLQKLFEAQRKLDEHIIREKGLEGKDLLPDKILALQVELGELANEWRGFKFWSEDQKPRTDMVKDCSFCRGTGAIEWSMKTCGKCYGTGIEKRWNPLLEEYVDCLHFILSIGLDVGIEVWEPHVSQVAISLKSGEPIIAQFQEVFYRVANLYFRADKETTWDYLVSHFIGLGLMLGFTWEQIEEAYFAKNRINHERQECGY
jgi:dimeric dUTPase (all-alpha-NTP-PPase superfamily)